MRDLLKFTKIVYTEKMIYVEDFSYLKIIHVIKPNGVIKTTEFRIRHAYDKNKKTENNLLSKTYKSIDPNLLDAFVLKVLDVISHPTDCPMLPDDCTGTLEICFGDAMKIKADRHVKNEKDYIVSLFLDLMKSASEMNID